MKAIIKIQDTVLGGWHELTMENGVVRLDGTELSLDFNEVALRVKQLLGAWEDEFEGLEEKVT